jgi:TonB family protein
LPLPPPSAADLASRALEQIRTQRPAPPVAAPPAAPLPADPRRGSIFGRIDRDITLQMYVESWRSKIERNSVLNYPASAKVRQRRDPIVTVVLRKDGSVEDVIIHVSSGVQELDDAIKRMVELYSPYSAFPPGLARRYDSLEIRRVWFFRDVLTIGEELR